MKTAVDKRMYVEASLRVLITTVINQAFTQEITQFRKPRAISHRRKRNGMVAFVKQRGRGVVVTGNHSTKLKSSMKSSR